MMNLVYNKKSLFKKNGKKGFTLVEIIVVLVILAILAAILIPTLTGYIDKANKKAVVAEARSALMAAQTIASEKYGAKDTTAPTAAEVAKLAEVAEGNIGTISPGTKNTVSFTYTSGNYKVVITNSVMGDVEDVATE